MSRRDDIAERVRQLWQTHETITLFEDGLYRHYRVNLPEPWSWVEIITWPGHLTITGDMSSTYVFARETDMLRDFFQAARGISYGYWAEKLTIRNAHAAIHEWDEEKFAEDVRQLIDSGHEITEEAIDDAEWVTSQPEAYAWIENAGLDLCDHYNMGEQYTDRYLRACHLIALFATEYRTTHKEENPND